MKLRHDSKTQQSEGDDPPPQHNDASPSSQQHALVGSVLEWTEADTIGSAMSMLDLVGLGTKLLHQQQQQEQQLQGVMPEALDSGKMIDCEKSLRHDHQPTTTTIPASAAAIDDFYSRSLLSPTAAAAVHIEVGAPVIKRYNFMVVGVNGSGKSTFCARLLRRYFPEFSLSSSSAEDAVVPTTTSLEDGRPTTTIAERARCERVQGPNGNTRIIFTIVDSPGYGDTMDNQTDRFAPIEQYIRRQNEQYEDRQVYRRPNDQSDDARIHCCFYFLMPHRVTKLDGGFMKRLQDMVPLVPIIAKADTYTTDEIAAQLFNLERCLVEYQITIFDFGENQLHNNSTTASHGRTTTRLTTANKECGDLGYHHQQHHHVTTDDDESTTSGSHGPTICPPESGSIGGEPVTTTTTTNNTSAVRPHPQPQCPPPPLKERPQRPNIFAVISGHRHYMWGVAREDDPHHSDTPRLHHTLFSSRHLHSLSRLQERANDLHETWLHNNEQLRRVKEAEERRAELERATKQRLVQNNVRLVWFILPLLFLLGCFLLLVRYNFFGPTTTPATPSL